MTISLLLEKAELNETFEQISFNSAFFYISPIANVTT